MRELKFRVWDGKCFRGNLKKYFLNLHDGEISEVAYSDLYDEYYDASERGSKLIIQQWTGLIDKNGVDIYEGDILKYNTNYNESLGGQVCNGVSVVSFENGSFMIDEDFADKDWAVEHIVIGNIFKNPELLKA